MGQFGMGWAETRVVQGVREVEIWIVGSEVRCLINVDFPVPEGPMTAMLKGLLRLERELGAGREANREGESVRVMGGTSEESMFASTGALCRRAQGNRQ